MFNVHPPVQQWTRVNFKESLNLVIADWYQQFWPAGSTLARDATGAVYETLGSRVTTAVAQGDGAGRRCRATAWLTGARVADRP